MEEQNATKKYKLDNFVYSPPHPFFGGGGVKVGKELT